MRHLMQYWMIQLLFISITYQSICQMLSTDGNSLLSSFLVTSLLIFFSYTRAVLIFLSDVFTRHYQLLKAVIFFHLFLPHIPVTFKLHVKSGQLHGKVVLCSFPTITYSNVLLSSSSQPSNVSLVA